jgi:transcriptional regulator with XRE-family HTH domain
MITSIFREVRTARKKTLKEVSEAVGCTVVYLSEIERGLKLPLHSNILPRLCEYFSLDYQDMQHKIFDDWREKKRLLTEKMISKYTV